jgi:hypothetical protein
MKQPLSAYRVLKICFIVIRTLFHSKFLNVKKDETMKLLSVLECFTLLTSLNSKGKIVYNLKNQRTPFMLVVVLRVVVETTSCYASSFSVRNRFVMEYDDIILLKFIIHCFHDK